MTTQPWCEPHACHPKTCAGRYHGPAVPYMLWALENLQAILDEAAVVGVKIVARYDGQGRRPPKVLR